MPNHNAFGLARRTTGVNHIGGVLGLQTHAAQQRRSSRQLQIAVRPHRIRLTRQLRCPVCMAHQPAGGCISQAYANALGRHIGIKRQPSRTRFGDGKLHHQQIQPARQPQPHHLPRAHTTRNQVVRGKIGGCIQLGIA